MKEAYFTHTGLDEKAQSMLAGCRFERERRPALAFRPAQAALLVLDLQNYFLDPASHAYIPSAPAVLPRVNSLVKAFYRLGRPVVFTRHLNTPANAGQMAVWWRDLLSPDSPLSEIASNLDPSAACILEKSQYDAFHETSLADILTHHQVRQVLITGVMTHLCCETTARSAFVHGYQVFFTVDGTATYKEAYHRASLLNLSHGFATPVLTGEIESVCCA